MADRRGSIVPLLILSFIIFSGGPARPPAARFEERPSIEDIIAQEHRSLDVLSNSSYGDIDSEHGQRLNLTGLEPERGYAWNSLPGVKGRAQEHLQYALGDEGRLLLEGNGGEDAPLYRNVTGYIQGKWMRSELQESMSTPDLNLSSYAPEGPFGQHIPRYFGRNITGTEGDVRLRLHERPRHGHLIDGDTMDNITAISAEVTIEGPVSGDEIELQVYGTYFLDIGQAIMTTTSDKFAGIFMLPHFGLSAHTFNASKALLRRDIAETIQAQEEGWTDRLNPWPSKLDGLESSFDPPNCELIIYLQQIPPTSSVTTRYTSSLLSFLEQELRLPTGAFLPSIPALQFSMLVFSPDCGYTLESPAPLTGPKTEILQRHGRQHLLVYSLTVGAQLLLFIRQMHEACTPSTRSRISWSTIGMLGMSDGFAAICFVVLSVGNPGVWVNLSTAAFLSLISVAFFGMRFILDVWTVQAPEREAVARAEAELERTRMERLRETLVRIRAERVERMEALAAARQVELSAQRAAAGGQTGAPNLATTGGQTLATNVAPGDGDVVATGNATPVEPAQIPDQTPPTTTAQPPTTEAPASTQPTTQPPAGMPLPAIAPLDTGASPVFYMPSDQQSIEPVAPQQPATTDPLAGPIRIAPRLPTFASLYFRYYLLLLILLFLSAAAVAWPAPLRRTYFTALAFVSLSVWLPQIHRNVLRNCRRALEWEFVVGQSLLRLVPMGYFFAYSDNIVFAEPDKKALGILAGWVALQVSVLASQEVVGPRWLVKKGWVPEAWDYHPIIREEDEEGGGGMMPVGGGRRGSVGASPTTAAQGKGKGKRTFDCAICMQDIVVAMEGNDGILARRNYMVTPCRHIFHAPCLAGWMKFRLQCPICRESLPPL